MAQPIFHIITKDHDQRRLDKWLKEKFPGLSFSLLQRLIRQGQIRIDGKRAKGNTLLTKGQTVRLPPLDIWDEDPFEALMRQKFTLSDDEIEDLQSCVLYMDDHLIIFNKPAGLAVQGGTGQKRHLDGYLSYLQYGKDMAPKILHRLDKETSGLLLLARTNEATRFYGDLLKNQGIDKFYLALCAGKAKHKKALIDAPLGKQKDGHYDKVKIDQDEGKDAQTYYESIAYSRTHDVSMVLASPLTGRTHQIRVHLSSHDLPILGDFKYKAPKDTMNMRPDYLYLHAFRLIVPKLSEKQEMIDVMAPIPSYYEEMISRLGMDQPEKIPGSFIAELRKHKNKKNI